MKKQIFFSTFLFTFISFNAKVGIGTEMIHNDLHVNGILQVKDISLGGTAITSGSSGTVGQVLISNGSGKARRRETPNKVSGTIYSANFIQGITADISGVSLPITIPSGVTRTLLFTVQGHAISAVSDSPSATQRVFVLERNGVIKQSSGCISHRDSLVNLPAPATFTDAITLGLGTYNFKIRYST
ncbi:hypothetical protein V3470_09675 [Flavobacterium oreochromis]|uniref:hypothetical protein n=1 Tax=Flavobacterium oreochromis TaxID=2906078 RepID=UPI000B4D15AD|nr:hypothetical protein [Flavobacterium oreochromis]OWP74639.1 hypothetical protein BWG23_13370 [Flavobacterium oreochromis]